MYIKEIYIESFGILKSQRLCPDREMSCYVLPNGRGKTTLTYFIKAMLYGLDDAKRSLADNERKRFIAWDCDRASGYLTVEFNGRNYRIERTFGRRASEDTLSVYDASCERKTDALTETPGEYMLGIDKDGFERTLFLSERLLRHDPSNDSLASRLSNQSGYDYGTDEYRRASERIDKRKKQLSRRGGGEIHDCRARLCALEAKYAELRGADEELEKITEALKDTEEGISAITRTKGADDYTNGGKKRSRGHISISLGIFITVFLLFCVLSNYVYRMQHLFLPICFMMLCAFFLVIMFDRRRSLGQGDEKSSSSGKDYLENVILLERERSALIQRREGILSALTNIQTVADEIDSLKDKISELEDELRVLNITEGILSEAKLAVSGKYFSRAKSVFLSYISELSSDGGVTLGGDLSIIRHDGGQTREIDAYSRGKREVYSFALRLAISEVLYTDKLPPLIIDDAFAAYDDDTLHASLKLLLKLSKKRQIIYLTPSHARASALVKGK